MKNTFSTLSVALFLALGIVFLAQARPTQPPPLQPVGDQGLTDFTGEINNPDSPGNRDRDESSGDAVFQEPADEPEVINEDSSSAASESSVTAEEDSFPVLGMIILIAALAAIV